MEVQGTFNAQRFFDTLAMLISKREGVKITVTVKDPKPEPAQGSGAGQEPESGVERKRTA